MARRRIGDALIEEGLLTAAQLRQALQMQKDKGGRLGEILLGLGVLSEESFQQFLARHFELPYFGRAELMTLKPDSRLMQQITYQMALQYLVLPHQKVGNTLELIALSPLSKEDTHFFRRQSHTLEIRYSLATRPALSQAIRYHYGRFLRKQQSSPEAQPARYSQEMLTLRKGGHCPHCGFPTDAPHCQQCGKSVRMSDDPFVGRVIGKWRLQHQLGEGGMGMVYAGEHTENSQKCAVKLLRTNLKRDDAVLQRFYREVQILRKLQHPCIIEVFEFDHRDDLGYYLAMELLEGCTFSDYLEEYGPELPYSEIYQIISQVCDAMAHAHAQGVVHRDLKPENIFLIGGPKQLGQIKILDFGIAKIEEHEKNRLTQTGMTLGTPHYLSPEQATAKEVDHRSDIYSLTVMLFELLTGDMLFDADSPFQYLMRHVYAEPRTLSQARPDKTYTAAIETLVARGLAKRPEDRHADIAQFKEHLRLAIQEILKFDPDENVQTVMPQSAGKFAQETGDFPKEGPLPTADLDEELTPAPSKPKREKLPSYIMSADEWDDEDDAFAQAAPSISSPLEILPKRPPGYRPPQSAEPGPEVAVSPPAPDPKSPASVAAKPKIMAPKQPRKRMQGAMWEAAHKRESRRRYLLWFLLLFVLAAGGTAAGTFPMWKHEFFPTENEVRQTKDIWKEASQLPRGNRAWRWRHRKKQIKRRRRRRRRRNRRRRRRRRKR